MQKKIEHVVLYERQQNLQLDQPLSNVTNRIEKIIGCPNKEQLHANNFNKNRNNSFPMFKPKHN